MKANIYKGGNGRYGVESGNAVIYEPDFPLKVAKRIAELESEDPPPVDWEDTEVILMREGLL